MLPQSINPLTATIGSRIAFSVGGGSAEERVLTRDQKTGPPAALPVTTLRGLALLGLREGDIFALRTPSGIVEPLRLEKVSYQPERAQHGPTGRPGGAVVSFPGPRSVAASAHPTGEDDDPGPRAA